jgi:hypothetical protein
MRRRLHVLGAAAFLLGLVATAFANSPTTPTGPPTISAITSRMSSVAGELAKIRTGEPVQKQEQRVIRDLDELIAALEKECQACCNGIKKNNPRSGLPDSVIRRGTGGIGDLLTPGPSEKDWAKLSSRERDRILQSMSEGFPPEYRTVLERYYRRLAEEKTVPAGTDAVKDKAALESDKP